MGLNKPERSRSAAIIFETSTPNLDALIDDPAISVMAMGIGSKFPLVISILKSARTFKGSTHETKQNATKTDAERKYRKTEDLIILKTYP